MRSHVVMFLTAVTAVLGVVLVQAGSPPGSPAPDQADTTVPDVPDEIMEMVLTETGILSQIRGQAMLSSLNRHFRDQYRKHCEPSTKIMLLLTNDAEFYDGHLPTRMERFVIHTKPGTSFHDLRDEITPQLAISLYDRLMQSRDIFVHTKQEKLKILLRDVNWRVFRNVVSAFHIRRDASFLLDVPDLQLDRDVGDVPGDIRDRLRVLIDRLAATGHLKGYLDTTERQVRARYPPPFDAAFLNNDVIAPLLFQEIRNSAQPELLLDVDVVWALLRYGIRFNRCLYLEFAFDQRLPHIYPLLGHSRPCCGNVFCLFQAVIQDGWSPQARRLWETHGFIADVRRDPCDFVQVLHEALRDGYGHEFLREIMPKPVFRDLIWERNKAGRTLLHEAFRRRDSDTILALFTQYDRLDISVEKHSRLLQASSQALLTYMNRSESLERFLALIAPPHKMKILDLIRAEPGDFIHMLKGGAFLPRRYDLLELAFELTCGDVGDGKESLAPTLVSALLDHPDVMERLREDADACRHLVALAERYDVHVESLDRLTKLHSKRHSTPLKALVSRFTHRGSTSRRAPSNARHL